MNNIQVQEIYQTLSSAVKFAMRNQYKQRENPLKVSLFLFEADITDLNILISSILYDNINEIDEIEELFGSKIKNIIIEINSNNIVSYEAKCVRIGIDFVNNLC